jgi:hypothetical protein
MTNLWIRGLLLALTLFERIPLSLDAWDPESGPGMDPNG